VTEKIYYDDPYQYDFLAVVTKTVRKDNRLGVVLDRTCFYPQGGGQPADHGFLNEARVYDVQSDGEDIIHYLANPLSESSVKGKVDEVRRRDFMQQHTGQHILSQSILRIGKWNTVSVHFGEDYTAVETDASSISSGKYSEVEKVANQVIRQNLSVKISWVNPEEVERFHIRRPPPEVKKVRIVQVGDFDASACGGLHVAGTGEVGLIKIIGDEKIRGRIRIHALIGDRAFRDYHKKMQVVQNLCQLMTCGEDILVQRVQELTEQSKELQRNYQKLQSERILLVAQEAVAGGIRIRDILFVQKIFDNTDNKLLRVFAESVLNESGRIVLVLSRNGEQVNWLAGHSLSRPFNLSEFCAPLLELIEARGGGKPEFVQGGGKKVAGIPHFITEFKKKLAEELNRNG
jgi:alanyl-tRNA synthetase